MTERTTYARVCDRLDEVTRELHDTDPNSDGEFDHHEWLLCEREALKLEKRQLETVVNANGEVEY